MDLTVSADISLGTSLWRPRKSPDYYFTIDIAVSWVTFYRSNATEK